MEAPELFRRLLRTETGEYLGSSKDFLQQVAEEPVQWMTMHGLSFEVYAYNEESAGKIAAALMALGAHDTHVVPMDHWRDGEYALVRGSM